VRLFCFPYAGGAAHIFRRWSQSLPEFVEVCAVQPPGRGSHWQERPFSNLTDLVSAAARALAIYMDRPFGFFGHSMGAMIGFELARHLRRVGAQGPEHLFLSGCRAPQSTHLSAVTFDLPEHEFLTEIRRLKGTSPEVLNNRELLQLMLPLLRADFAITETYKYRDEPPLKCPFTVFGGSEDKEVRVESLRAWRRHTTASFSLRILPGDQFFLNTSQGLLLEAIAQDLRRLDRNFS